MDDLIIHTQISMLAYIGQLAAKLETKLGVKFTPLNLDSQPTELEMPEGNICGLENFSYFERSDPVAEVVGQITLGTVKDADNEMLIRGLSMVLSDTRELSEIPLINSDTGALLGSILFKGYRSVPPSVTGEVKVFQGVIFDASILLER